MSHAATNWAIQQRGIRPAAKIVLWHLADCHNPTKGCFPAQAYLSEVCEMSLRSVRDQIAILEECDLVKREPRKRDNGQHSSDRYFLAFENGFDQQPVAKFASGKIASKPVANSRQNQWQNLPTNNPVIITRNEPVNICASLDGFEEFWEIYNHKKARSKCEALWARKRLAEKSQVIIDGARQYAASRGSNPKYWKHPHGWLSDERWTDELQQPVSKHSNSFDAVDQAADVAARFAA